MTLGPADFESEYGCLTRQQVRMYDLAWSYYPHPLSIEQLIHHWAYEISASIPLRSVLFILDHLAMHGYWRTEV